MGKETALDRLLLNETELFVQAQSDPEDYADILRADPTTFKELLSLEKKADKDMRKYLKDFAERAVSYVNWREFEARKATDVVDPIGSEGWQQEQLIFKKEVYETVFNSTLVGLTAGTNLYNIPIDEFNLVNIAQVTSNKHIAQLSKTVTKSSKKMVRDSILTSIELGESVSGASERLATIIDNPSRARLIAHMESTSSYGRGMFEFGEASGATGKWWDAVLDKRTTQICSGLSSKYGSPGDAIGIGEEFEDILVPSSFRPLMYNPAHFYCRSGVVFIYP